VIVTRTGPSEADALIGQRCGDSYVITSLLGEGGMGAVYLATSEALAGKLAAVKVLLPELTRRANSLARFRAEVYAAGKIDDPNIVRVFDTGELRGGRAYMLMEYCPGGSLDALLKQRGALPFELILTVLSPIGSALETAHTDAKITHRDIKPANILLVMENGLLRGKLADFGIAKLHDLQLGFFLKTATQKIMGSPGYMAPEQCAGKHGDVDGRADIYAFGSVLYEVVTGQRPYPGNSMFDLIHNVVSNAPFLPPRKLRRDLPPEWEAVILGCLAHRREDRIQTIKEVIRRLARSIPNGESLMSFVAPRLVDSKSAPTAVTISDGIGPAATLWSGAHSVIGPHRNGGTPPFARMLAACLASAVVGSGMTALVTHGRAGGVSAPAPSPSPMVSAPSDAGRCEDDHGAAASTAVAPAHVDGHVDAGHIAAASGVAGGVAGIEAPRALAAAGKPQRPADRRAAPQAPASVPVPRGALRIEVEPWADVTIRGQKNAYTTPVTIPLSAGPHRIVLTKGTQKETVDVTITPNVTTRITRSW
jgi:serine/threonine-protein kinase